jgi:hypothetical protein
VGRPDGEAGRPEVEGLLRPYPGQPGATVEFWQWLATLTDDDLLTLDEAAAMARMPVETFRYVRNHNRGGPRGFRMGKRVMFPKGQVRQWLKTIQASQAGAA